MKKDLHELLPMARGVVLCCWHPLCRDRSRGPSENQESIVHKVQMHKRGNASTTLACVRFVPQGSSQVSEVFQSCC